MHSVTAAALMNSMLSIPGNGYGWLLEGIAIRASHCFVMCFVLFYYIFFNPSVEIFLLLLHSAFIVICIDFCRIVENVLSDNFIDFPDRMFL